MSCDKLCWTPSERGLFDVRSFYNVFVPHDDSLFPWKSIWQIEVSLRVPFFAWSTALGKIFTLDNIGKRLVIVVDWCFVRGAESLWIIFFSIMRLLCLMECHLQLCWVVLGYA